MFIRFYRNSFTENICKICGAKSKTISSIIGVCVDCLRRNPDALKIALKTHEKSKSKYGLPSQPPKDKDGLKCSLCANECVIPKNGYGFCGLVRNINGRLIRLAGTPNKAIVEYYYDELPTNCVAEWFCPGCTGRGYPKYALKNGPEYGYYNLAVFYGACNLDCIFCQNWSYRNLTYNLAPTMSAKTLASKVNEKVTCICFFGGDPSPQISHALATAKMALKWAENRNRILRICWETNGLMNSRLLEAATKISLKSGGIVKIDFKAWSPSVYKALTGVDNSKVLENIKIVSKYIDERREVPLLCISTLLVPGYVDEYEVRMISRFIASIDPEIPYSLLAFHPDYLLTDLPPTSRRHAYNCLKIAREEGLKNINIGNIWLLGNYY